MVKILEIAVKKTARLPWWCRSALDLFLLLLLLALGAPLIAPHDPGHLYLDHLNEAPSLNFIFGTDPLGRDLFSVVLYGLRTSLAIGLLSALIISTVGLIVGGLAALSSSLVDRLLMRLLELLNAVPAILIVLAVGAFFHSEDLLSISLVVGLTSWFSLARIVRLEAKSISSETYVEAAYMMGGSFLHILRRHILPNILPQILFVLISSVNFAISMEATLSFLGLGLPPQEISLGSLLSLSSRALLLNAWWVIVFPASALILLLLSVSAIGACIKFRLQDSA